MNFQKKLFLISAAFGTVNIAVLFFIFWYLFPALKEASKELSSVELNLLPTYDEQSKQALNKYEKMKQSYQIIENLFANPAAPLVIINFLEKIAEEEKLIIEISPIDIEKYQHDLWKFLGFQINLSGNFVNIQKFIDKIENSKYLFEINSLIIKKNLRKSAEEKYLLSPEAKKINEATAVIILKIYINDNEREN